MEIKTNIPQRGEGRFAMMEGNKQIGEMVVEISGKNLIVYHTEISSEEQGKDLGKNLLQAMVDYARKEKLKVVPYCPYVLVQFKRHPEYADVWNKDGLPQEEKNFDE